MELRIFEEVIGDPDPGAPIGKTEVARLTLVSDMLDVDAVIARHVTRQWKEVRRSHVRGGHPDRASATAAIEMAQGQGDEPLERAIAKAQAGFRNGAFLFFWNDEQITRPDTRLNVANENEAVFLRLFPMKGG